MNTKVYKNSDTGNIRALNTRESNNISIDKSLMKGLSIPLYLTARIKITRRQNGECQVFIQENKNTKSTKRKGAKKGQRVQKGITRRGKTSLRIVSDCYELLVTNNDFYNKYELVDNKYNSYCRFITLTFRNIIPSDKEAKKLLDNFLKRFRRLKKHSIHYSWVAERQKRGAIHFHILTPEKIYNDTNFCNSTKIRMNENLWINKSWNEVVMNWALKNKKINKIEFDKWKNELFLSNGYYKSLVNYWIGSRTTQPRKPKKSNYLLLPNCTHVLKAGNYMGKYMSKENENIIGGMWDVSQSSRDFLQKTEVINKGVNTIFSGNQIVNYIYHKLKKRNLKPQMFELPHNECKIVWINKGYYHLVLQYYYEYCELVRLNLIIPNKIKSI
jgi:hypothetical protein